MELFKFEIAQAEIDFRRERAERSAYRSSRGRPRTWTRAERKRAQRPLLGHQH